MVIIRNICARGGSKGLPCKNTRLVGGKPLMTWTLGQALATKVFDFVVASNDCPAIFSVAHDADAHYMIDRLPPLLAIDQAGKIPAIAHALQTTETLLGKKAAILVDLAAISPLRDLGDITGAIDLLRATGATHVMTGMTARRSPYFDMVERSSDNCVRISKSLPQMVLRRQDSPACFDMNGLVYVWNRDRLLDDPQLFYRDTQLYEMPKERSNDTDSTLNF